MVPSQPQQTSPSPGRGRWAFPSSPPPCFYFLASLCPELCHPPPVQGLKGVGLRRAGRCQHFLKPSIKIQLPWRRDQSREIHAIIHNESFFPHRHNFLTLQPEVDSWFPEISDPAESVRTGGKGEAWQAPAPCHESSSWNVSEIIFNGEIALRRGWPYSLVSSSRGSGWARGRERSCAPTPKSILSHRQLPTTSEVHAAQ